MTFRYPKWLAYSKFIVAIAMFAILYLTTVPTVWDWLLFLPLFLFVIYEGARTYSYSLTVNGDLISLAGIKRGEYRVSDIAAVDVWVAKAGRIAVVTFANREKLNFSSRLVDFEKAVALLRKQANLPEPSEH